MRSLARARGFAGALAVALMTAGLTGWLGAAGPVQAADDPGNIPGVPLTAIVVSGQLGGPIYDVVYRVDVPAGHVLLLSMTGDTGTDFDLYLFDSTATDIYADPPVGLVARSTGPTSTESISYPSVPGGTYYVDLSGFSDVLGEYRLAVKIAADTTSPQVTLALNGGAPATNDRTVTASVVATDDLSGVVGMQFSSDGATWLDWRTYAPTVLWSFNPPDGAKSLWVRVRDQAGNVSTPARASILLDTVPPRVLTVTPAPDGSVPVLRPVFAVTFSEPIEPASWIAAGLILQDPTSTVVYGTYAYDPRTATGTFTPASDLQPGARYIVTLAAVTDLAGNPLVSIGTWAITPLIGPSITLRASATLVPRDGSVTLAGRIRPNPAGSLTLERSVGDGPYATLGPLLPDPDGAFTSHVPVAANTRFLVRYAGSQTAAAAASTSVRVLVRRELTFRGLDAAVTRITTPGRPIALAATVEPAAPSVPVTLHVYEYDPARSSYVLRTTIARTSTSGTAGFSWRPSRPGRYYLRLATPPTPLFANGISAAYRWVVR